MADQPRRFVHDQQVGVLVDDVEKFFQAQGIVTTDGRRGTRILFFTEGNEGNKNENGFDANCANLRQFAKFVSTLWLSLFSSVQIPAFQIPASLGRGERLWSRVFNRHAAKPPRFLTTDGRRGTRILFFTEGNEGNKNEMVLTLIAPICANL